MAITFTDPGVDTGVTTGSTTYDSGSWTPSADSLIIAFVYYRGSAASPTSVVHAPGGSQISLTQIATVDRGTAGRHELWVGSAGASPPTGVTRATFSAAGTGGHVHVFDATGVDLSGGAAAAIVQSNTASQANTGTPSVSLASGAGNADNRCIAAFGSAQQNTTTPRTNWTEQGETTFSAPTSLLETQYRTDSFEQTGSGSSGVGTDDWSNIIAELKAASSATVSFEVGMVPIGF